jgi:hypothetical protein
MDFKSSLISINRSRIGLSISVKGPILVTSLTVSQSPESPKRKRMYYLRVAQAILMQCLSQSLISTSNIMQTSHLITVIPLLRKQQPLQPLPRNLQRRQREQANRQFLKSPKSKRPNHVIRSSN